MKLKENKRKCIVCNRPAVYTEEFCSLLCWHADVQLKVGLLNEVARSMAPSVGVSGPAGGGDRIRQGPTAINLAITGTFVVSGSATGSYTFVDPNNDAEGTSTFKWYRADDTAGTNKTQLSFTTTEMAISASEQDKYLIFEVTPVSLAEPYTGTAAEIYSSQTCSAA